VKAIDEFGIEWCISVVMRMLKMQSLVFKLAQDVMLDVGGTKTTFVMKVIGEKNDAVNVIRGIT
tara:strand:- start:110 stop:301 length:192 start_codon:yes stop_codon:yes gene_type:complete